MKRCGMQLLGPWLVSDHWFSQALAAYRNGDLKPSMQLNAKDEGFDFERGPEGMLIVPISGVMSKRLTSFDGGTSTIAVRKVLHDALTDASVTGVMLAIDSPGGTAAGTFELAEEVKKFAEVKPIRAHIQDIGASAAYWVASQTQLISVNRLGEVGSIGTVAVLVDSSKAVEAAGLKVHVISTGEFKGAGAPGTEVTQDQLDLFQEQVDDFNAHFLTGISEGRGLTGSALTGIATGRVWIAEKAQRLGLVDLIMSFDDAVAEFAEELRPESTDSENLSSRIGMAQLELELSRGQKSIK